MGVIPGLSSLGFLPYRFDFTNFKTFYTYDKFTPASVPVQFIYVTGQAHIVYWPFSMSPEGGWGGVGDPNIK